MVTVAETASPSVAIRPDVIGAAVQLMNETRRAVPTHWMTVQFLNVGSSRVKGDFKVAAALHPRHAPSCK
jgi:hypothetical protein